jgi:hypothetical protein
MTSFRDPNAKSDRTQRRGNGGQVGRQGFERGWVRSRQSARAGTAISAPTTERQERRDQESAQDRHARGAWGSVGSGERGVRPDHDRAPRGSWGQGLLGSDLVCAVKRCWSSEA